MLGRLSAAQEKEILLNQLCDPNDSISLRLLQIHHDALMQQEESSENHYLPKHRHKHSDADGSSDPRSRSRE